jgi:hypothetical protein
MYAVEVIRIASNFKTIEEARAYALTYRQRGYGTEVITQEEAARRSSEQQQDLTRLTPESIT